MPEIAVDYEVRAFHLLQDPDSLRAGLEVAEDSRIDSDIQALTLERSRSSAQARKVVGFGALAVCSESDIPIGFGVATLRGLSPGSWLLDHVETAADYRRQGVGRRVVELLVSRAEFSGGLSICVDTLRRSEGFFRKIGFEEQERSSDSLTRKL